MEHHDIENLERVTSRYKIRYDDLDIAFKEELVGNRVYLPINLTMLLKDISEYIDSIPDNSQYELNVAISIMNLFAHYKHYYATRETSKCIIIAYVRDNYIYNKYKKILDNITSICSYFKNVYLVITPSDDKRTWNKPYVHTVCGCISYMDSLVVDKKVNRTIHLLSQYTVDKQILNCIPTKHAYKINKEKTTKLSYISKFELMTTALKSNFYEICMCKSELEALFMSIGKFFNTIVCTPMYSSKPAPAIKYTLNMRTKHKIELLRVFLEYSLKSDSTLPITIQFYNYLKKNNVFATERDAEDFETYLKRYDYRYQNIGDINYVLKPLIDTWKKKLKDYALSRESEHYKLLVDHQLYANWLE